ncbi:MAG: Mov34/MPN/PAD-1 family protein [Methanolinea sp.]|nr:Mov34/MPN/PAD-1 family protein [Methanolinea sp.]
MKVQGIRRKLLALLLELGRENHPQEFAGILREEGGIISEFTLLPGTVTGDESATLLLDMMPLDTHVAGSVHSHPNGVLSPSLADLSFFPRAGRYHIIVGYPYDRRSWRCYRADGTPSRLEVVP